MKVELKNVKIAEFLSEETTAFTASVYIDGKRAGSVENHGTGGNNNVFLEKEYRQPFADYISTLPPEPPMADYPELGSLDINEDYFFSLLLQDWQQQNDIRRWARKNLVCKPKGVKAAEYTLFTLPAIVLDHPQARAAFAQRVLAQHPDLEVVA